MADEKVEPDTVGWLRLAMAVRWVDAVAPPDTATMRLLWRVLGATQQRALWLRLGLCGDPLSLPEAAKAAGMTKEHMRQRYAAAEADLCRGYAYLRTLREGEKAAPADGSTSITRIPLWNAARSTT